MEKTKQEYGFEELIRQGKKIVPLGNGKVPIDRNWKTHDYSIEDIYRNITTGRNVGWFLGKHDLVLNIDIKLGGIESFKRLCQETRLFGGDDHLCEDDINVLTVSNGYHIYLTNPIGDVYKKLRDFPGITIISGYKNYLNSKKSKAEGISSNDPIYSSNDAFVIIPPSVVDGKKYTWCNGHSFKVKTMPESLAEILIKNNNIIKNLKVELNKTTDDLEFSKVKKNLWLSKFEIEEILKQIDFNDCKGSRDIDIGVILHKWDSEWGFTLWSNWHGNDDLDELRGLWETFKDRIPKKNLLFYLKDAEEMIRTKEINDLCYRLENCEKGDFNDLVDFIKTQDYTLVEQELLVNSYILRFRKPEYGKVKIPKLKVRELLTKKVLKDDVVKNEPKPKWCDDLVYIKTRRCFINVNKPSIPITKDAFNGEFGKYVPTSGTTKPPAFKYISDNGCVSFVDNEVYDPTREETFFYDQGVFSYNSYRHDLVPQSKPLSEFDEDDEDAIEFFKFHLSTIIGDDKIVNIFLQWIAHQVQNPGIKLHWLPLIQGIQGIGKSIIGKLFREIIGHAHVGLVPPEELKGTWTDWAVRKVLNILDEINIMGKSVHDIDRRLKIFTTEPTIKVSEKYVSNYEVKNVTNYIGFTNDKEAVKITKGDRRWFIIHSPIQNMEEFEDKVHMKREDYFHKLAYYINNKGSAFRTWFLEYPISEEFRNYTEAPNTKAKDILIANMGHLSEESSMINELLTKGGEGFSVNVISTSHLFKAYQDLYPDEPMMSTKEKAKALKSLDYYRVPFQVSFGGKNLRLWARTVELSNDINELKLELTKTFSKD